MDVGLLFGLHRLEGGSVLVLGEVHDREALVVAAGRSFSCTDTQTDRGR